MHHIQHDKLLLNSKKACNIIPSFTYTQNTCAFSWVIPKQRTPIDLLLHHPFEGEGLCTIAIKLGGILAKQQQHRISQQLPCVQTYDGRTLYIIFWLKKADRMNLLLLRICLHTSFK